MLEVTKTILAKWRDESDNQDEELGNDEQNGHFILSIGPIASCFRIKVFDDMDKEQLMLE
jgi:hypothetical protein